MDLRASKGSPLVRSSNLGSKQSLLSKRRLRCCWKSSQLKDCAVQCSLHSYSRSKGIKAASALSTSCGSTPNEEIKWKERPIRTLLIDNYDSYTYNLYQILCVINQGAQSMIIGCEFFVWRENCTMHCLFEESCETLQAKILDKISDVTYRLKLPEGWKICNAFHVSLLRSFVGEVPEDLPNEEQREVEELDEILVLEQILAHKERKTRFEEFCKKILLHEVIPISNSPEPEIIVISNSPKPEPILEAAAPLEVSVLELITKNISKQPTFYRNHRQLKQQHEASKGSSAISRWAYLVAHISDPCRVLGRECLDAGQVPPREPRPTFKSFLSDGGKVEDLPILSLCKRILQRSKRQQLPRPPPSQLKALIPAEKAEDPDNSGSCVTLDKHKTPSVAVIQAEKLASSPLQNKFFFSEHVPNVVVNDNSSNLKIPIVTFNGAKDKIDANSCSTTSIVVIEPLDTTFSTDKSLQMDIPPNTTLSQSTISLQEDCTDPDKPMEYLTNFQPVVFTQQKTQVSLPIVSLEADTNSIFSCTKLEVTNDFDQGTNQVADIIILQFGKIIMVNNSAMTWDLIETPPRVIKNDELSWENLHTLLREGSAFDNIVISPGPGSPMCAKDIGICLQVLQECVDIPILGVCLGHQALGYVNGARVVHAPEPVHGRLSEVEHTNCPLFKGIPSGKGSGFQVVRYHSLMLDRMSLPEDLVPTAWTLRTSPTQFSEAPPVTNLEHERTLIKGNICVSLDKSNILANQDSSFTRGRPDIRACEPSRLQTTVETHVALDTSCKINAEVIMAISHRKRPHYGVQFHPESVATSFGRQILENFCEITQKHCIEKKAKDSVQRHASRQTVSEDLRYSGGSRSFPLRIYWEKVDGIANEAGGSEGIFCGLFGEGTAKDTFWLDSALQPGEAHFSFMGGKGGRLWKRLTYFLNGKHGSGGVLRVENDTHVEELRLEKGFLNFLSRELESYTTSKLDSEGLPFDFWGGYVGYLGYELKAECGARFNQHKSKLPDACYFFVDRFIAVDHVTNDVYAVVLYTETSNGRVNNHTWANSGNASDETYKHFTKSALSSSVLASDNPTIECSQKLSAEIWVKETMQKLLGLVEGGRDMAIERRYLSQLASSSLGSINTATHLVIAKSRKQYMADVKSCLEYIREGESYELCLTTQLQKRVNSLDALGLYLTLRKMNPAPYAAWLNFGSEEVCVCCSSPERFLRLDQNGMLEAKPIKGTIPRGQSHAEDEALRIKLQYSEKDRAENLMIVDLLRNDLGRVCKPGSVHVPNLMAVESYATVHTMGAGAGAAAAAYAPYGRNQARQVREGGVGADIEKEDAYLNTSQRQEEKGNVCEMANESSLDSVLQESVGIVEESRELDVVWDKIQEELDVIVAESRPEIDFLSHMVCTFGSQRSQNTAD
ncbi:hypothetical protein L7F22_028364 [Adiantum nelumboides]|nr:hypothetical protein [Adiantum nelumboides]